MKKVKSQRISVSRYSSVITLCSYSLGVILAAAAAAAFSPLVIVRFYRWRSECSILGKVVRSEYRLSLLGEQEGTE